MLISPFMKASEGRSDTYSWLKRPIVSFNRFLLGSQGEWVRGPRTIGETNAAAGCSDCPDDVQGSKRDEKPASRRLT